MSQQNQRSAELTTLESNIELFPGKIPPFQDLVRAKRDILLNMDREDHFFIIDLGEVYKKLDQWRHHLPRVTPFYAMKCNPDPEVCRLLADAGTGFDCASKGEIDQILSLGVHPSRIVYANPCKQGAYIKYANSVNVSLMTFDDSNELVKIKKHYPNARLILRIQSSKEYKAKHDFNKKFGCDPEMARQLLGQAKTMELNVVGVSFHVGSLPNEVECFASTIKAAHKVFTLGEELGFSMEILDIGGGFPGYDTDGMSFKKVADTVNRALDIYFPPSRGVNIIAEPGRYLVTSAFTIAVNVIAKKAIPTCKTRNGRSSIHRTNSKPIPAFDDCNDSDSAVDLDSSVEDVDLGDNNSQDTLMMYYINDGIYGSFNNVFTDHAIISPVLVEDHKESIKRRKYPSIMWGPTCDGLDLVLPECELPDMEVGQWLYFHNMGAYTTTMNTGFNGIPKPHHFYVCSNRLWNEVYPVLSTPTNNVSQTSWDALEEQFWTKCACPPKDLTGIIRSKHHKILSENIMEPDVFLTPTDESSEPIFRTQRKLSYRLALSQGE